MRDRRSVMLGLAIGLLGAGGQLLLFHAVRVGPPYLIFPIISLSPALTIALSLAFLKERTGMMGAIGIVLALVALPLFDYRADGAAGNRPVVRARARDPGGLGRAGLRHQAREPSDGSREHLLLHDAERAAAGPGRARDDRLLQPINYGLDGPGLAAAIQILNAVGALTLVFAFRYGKAIIVAPLVNAGAPLLTAVLSMFLLGVVPGPMKIAGIALALLAALLLALQPDSPAQEARA